VASGRSPKRASIVGGSKGEDAERKEGRMREPLDYDTPTPRKWKGHVAIWIGLGILLILALAFFA
jgi:hypothetical protein